MKRLLLPKGKVYPTFLFLRILPWKPKRIHWAMGCVKADEIQAFHVAQEPFDCQLEYEVAKKQEI